jgi:Cu+-exporting ATPase
MRSSSFAMLDKFLSLSRQSIVVIKLSFVLSFLYNAIGLSFAVSGKLSPLISAVLMPLSSISVVLFTTIATTMLARRQGLK